jgi:hypothetical protein
MLTLKPVKLAAVDADRYVVSFVSDGGEVDYVFTITGSDIKGVQWETEFWNATKDDPGVPTLMQCILNFHESR